MPETTCWMKLYGYPYGVGYHIVPHYAKKLEKLEKERQEKVRNAQ